MKTDLGSKEKNVIQAVLVSAAILVAYTCRMILKVGILDLTLSLIRTIIYLALFMVWGVSLMIRIQQKQVQRYMIATDVLIVFWIFIRTMKFYIVTTEMASRYIWYLYYLPMMFIPLLGMLVAMSVGKPDNYRLPKKCIVLFIIPAVLFLLVMTNDLHQLIFMFPEDVPRRVWSDDTYGYNFLFYFVRVWEVFCSVGAFVIMAVKCRVPGSKKYFWLPTIPLALSLLYWALYGFGYEWFSYLFGDTTIVQSLLIAGAYEACIRLGLIHSNSQYAELFRASKGCSAQITDEKYIVRYASGDARTVTEEQMKSAIEKPLRLEDGNILHSMKVRGGYAVWTEDNSEMLRLREKLENTQQKLRERVNLLRYEYEQEKSRKEIEEQNKLYDLLQCVTQKQIDRIYLYVEEYQRVEKNSEASRTILAKTAVLCSFIKRRKHLELLVYNDYHVGASELKGAFSESLRTIEMLGVSHSLFMDTEKILEGKAVTTCYDFFEDVVEMGIDSLSSINVRVARIDGRLRINISAECSADLSKLGMTYPNAEFELYEGEWTCLLVMED